MMNEDYYYELKYKYNDEEITFKFSAEITATELAGRLREFLLACSWTPATVDDVIPVDNE